MADKALQESETRIRNALAEIEAQAADARLRAHSAENLNAPMAQRRAILQAEMAEAAAVQIRAVLKDPKKPLPRLTGDMSKLLPDLLRIRTAALHGESVSHHNPKGDGLSLTRGKDRVLIRSGSVAIDLPHDASASRVRDSVTRLPETSIAHLAHELHVSVQDPQHPTHHEISLVAERLHSYAATAHTHRLDAKAQPGHHESLRDLNDESYSFR